MEPGGAVRIKATVREALPSALFRVELENGRQVLAHMAEAFRLHAVRLLPGDEVTLELAPHDGRRGRIVGRTGAMSSLREKGSSS